MTGNKVAKQSQIAGNYGPSDRFCSGIWGNEIVEKNLFQGGQLALDLLGLGVLCSHHPVRNYRYVCPTVYGWCGAPGHPKTEEDSNFQENT